MSDQNQLKQQAAQAALTLLPANEIIGVGTGSTVNFLIDLLPQIGVRQALASSTATQQRLQKLGIEVLDPNTTGPINTYVDGADEIDGDMRMIKGGGGALTREKILASMATTIICMADQSKLVEQLGRFPLPIEVLPMARSYVARELVALGGNPVYRTGFVTDNGNVILDCYHLDFNQPDELDHRLNNITGVVTHGLFNQQKATVACIAGPAGVQIHHHVIA